MDQITTFTKLRQSLLAYAMQFRSAELEIFAIEMQMEADTGLSCDPALFQEFSKNWKGEASLSDAYARAADFVEKELVTLLKIPEASRIVADLRHASSVPSNVRAPLDWS